MFITNKQTHGLTYIQKEREKDKEIEIEMKMETEREKATRTLPWLATRDFLLD